MVLQNRFTFKEAIAGLRANDEKRLELTLHGMFIRDEEAKALAIILATNSTLKLLDLVFNQINDEGVKTLAAALATNSTLEKLDLCVNRIKGEGAKALANALATNSTLKELRLCTNSIGDEGAKALANALATNNTLEKLDLWNNDIGIGGERAEAHIYFFLRLNRKGRDSVFSPTPIPLSIWTKIAAGPPGIFYYLLRKRAGFIFLREK